MIILNIFLWRTNTNYNNFSIASGQPLSYSWRAHDDESRSSDELTERTALYELLPCFAFSLGSLPATHKSKGQAGFAPPRDTITIQHYDDYPP